MGQRFADLEPEKFIRKDPRAFVGPTGKIRYREFPKEELMNMTIEEIFEVLESEGFDTMKHYIKYDTIGEEFRVYIQTVEA